LFLWFMWRFLGDFVHLLICWFLSMNITDLRTISRRLDSEQYFITLDMFVADMKRMFSNARTYNSPDTIYYKCTNRYRVPFSLFPCFWFCLDHQCCMRKVLLTTKWKLFQVGCFLHE
jgi:hypothetical protein